MKNLKVSCYISFKKWQRFLALNMKNCQTFLELDMKIRQRFTCMSLESFLEMLLSSKDTMGKHCPVSMSSIRKCCPISMSKFRKHFLVSETDCHYNTRAHCISKNFLILIFVPNLWQSWCFLDINLDISVSAVQACWNEP